MNGQMGTMGTVGVSDLSKLDEDQMKALFRDFQGEKDELAVQSQLAEALRQGNDTQGVTVGNQYVAASPWSHVADAVSKGVGTYQMLDAAKKSKELSAADTQRQEMMAKMMRDEQMRQQQQQMMNQQNSGRTYGQQPMMPPMGA